MIAALLFLSSLVFIPGGGPFVDAYDLPKTVIVGALAVMVWIDFYLRARDGEKISFPLAGPIAALLAVSALSWINAVNTHYFLYAFGAQLAGFTFFSYGVNLRLTPRASHLLFLAPVVIVVAYALTHWLGITTTFGNQERGSAMVALAVGITIHYLVQKFKDSKIQSAAFCALLVAQLFFLWRAEMRSALVGLGVGLIAWLAFDLRARKTAAALIVSAIIVMAARPDLLSRFALDEGRPAIWQAAWSLGRAEGWPLGIGLGQWRLHAQAWIHEAEFGADYWRELHNDYLQILIEAGPLALAAWGYLLWRIMWPPEGNRQQVIGNSKNALIVGLIAVLVNAFFLFPFQLPIEAAWFWLVAGIYRREA